MMRFRLQAAALLLSGVSFCAQAEDGAPLEGDAYRLADEAYRELALGHVEAAGSAAAKALQLRPDSKQLGLLLLDIQVRQGDLETARQQADALLARFPNDPQVLVQRGYLAQRQQRHQAAMEDFYAALGQPGLDAAQERNVRLAWADSALATKQYRVAIDALAPYAVERDAAVQLSRAYAYAGQGDREQAHAAAQLAAGSGSDSQHEAARRLLEQTKPAVLSDLDLAYAALRDKNDRDALTAFQRAFADQPGTVAQYSDAGYAAKRLGDNAAAISLFEKALDANAQLPPGERVFDAQLEFGYRREIQEMSRTFGAVANVSYQSNGFAPQNNINAMQGGLEVYWQPEEGGYRNGKIFQVFARGYETLYDKNGGATGSATAQGSIGARYKPIGDMNVVLTAEKLFRVGNLASDDLLLRAGYSTGDGSDIRPYQKDWSVWQFYTEGAYFAQAGRYIQSLDTRYGHSWRMDAMDRRLVMSPHLALIGNFDSRAAQQTALGVGPGVSLRYWFRESTYQAPASWFELTAQYLAELTQTGREQGLILNAILWY
ncbi:MAG TPA: tetratricopeptide repeat protein [Gallionella sp.]|nr:tetratricopeptide repeat protein [Gallionella sp.]